jgi:RND superfamily putative drug exporter
VAVVAFIAALLTGHDVHDRLVLGDTVPIGSSSLETETVLQRAFGAGNADFAVIARAAQPVDTPGVAAAGSQLTARVARDPGVLQIASYWKGPAPALRSRDGRAAAILIHLKGDNAQRNNTARRLMHGLNSHYGPLTLAATGEAQVRIEAQDRSESDIRTGELIAAPLTLIILLLVFGSLIAALLPVLVGAFAVVATMAVLRLLTEAVEISVFAMSITTALGFALAVDFSLFIVTRFHEQLAHGLTPQAAIGVTMRTTGRAMAYSAATVALSMTALLLFPFDILRSFAIGGMTISILSAAASLIVLPAMLVLLGDRINRLSVPGPWRADRVPAEPVERGLWFRLAIGVMRRPLRVAAPTVVLLIALGSPFLNARFGTLDDRVLPPQAPAAQASQALRRDFVGQEGVAATMALLPHLHLTSAGHDADQAAAARLDDYARRLSATDGVLRVDTATGTYAHGTGTVAADRTSSASRFTGTAGTWLLITTAEESYSVDNSQVVQRLRQLPAPGKVSFAGPGAQLDEIRRGIADTLPLALILIAAATFAMATLLTGSIVLALKALVMNALSLTPPSASWSTSSRTATCAGWSATSPSRETSTL